MVHHIVWCFVNYLICLRKSSINNTFPHHVFINAFVALKGIQYFMKSAPNDLGSCWIKFHCICMEAFKMSQTLFCAVMQRLLHRASSGHRAKGQDAFFLQILFEFALCYSHGRHYIVYAFSFILTRIYITSP